MGKDHSFEVYWSLNFIQTTGQASKDISHQHHLLNPLFLLSLTASGRKLPPTTHLRPLGISPWTPFCRSGMYQPPPPASTHAPSAALGSLILNLPQSNLSWPCIFTLRCSGLWQARYVPMGAYLKGYLKNSFLICYFFLHSEWKVFACFCLLF